MKNQIPRRVLIVEPAGQLWGSERALLDLIAHLSARRWSITVAMPPDTRLEPLLSRFSVNIVTGPIGVLHQRGRFSRAVAAGWLWMLVQKMKPDIIHLNQSGLSRIAGISRLGSTALLVCHVRLYEDAVKFRSDKSVISPDAYVAISRFIEKTLRDRVPNENAGYTYESEVRSASGSPIRLIYDPFDIDSFEEAQLQDARHSLRQELGLSDAAKLVTLVGRICYEKGQDVFLSGAARVTTPGVHFLIAGMEPTGNPAESHFAAELRTRANTGSLSGRVHLLGERRDVGRLLKASNAAVLASRGEPLGRVLLEALALGTPVIGPNYGGPLEILGDGERGFVFQSEDASSLAAAIDDTLSDPSAAHARTVKGAQWVKEMCSPSTHAEAIESLWNDLRRR